MAVEARLGNQDANFLFWHQGNREPQSSIRAEMLGIGHAPCGLG
jgi:hypothetical protein